LLSRREVARPSREDGQAVIEASQERGWTKQAHAGGGQLDRQWEPIQAPADRYDVGDIAGIQMEGRFHGLRPLDKETNSRKRQRSLGGKVRARRGKRQR
jgi:hypothetical protein